MERTLVAWRALTNQLVAMEFATLLYLCTLEDNDMSDCNPLMSTCNKD